MAGNSATGRVSETRYRLGVALAGLGTVACFLAASLLSGHVASDVDGPDGEMSRVTAVQAVGPDQP